MFRKAIIATAAAGMLAMGGLAASTATAAAAGPSAGFQVGGPGFNLQFGMGPGQQWGGHHHNKSCTPVTQNVKWWDKWGNPRWSKVVVGYNCHPKHGPKPFPGHGGPWGPKPPHNGPGFPGGHHGGGW